MAKTKTQREYFVEMVEIFKGLGEEYTDYVSFCNGRIEMLDKKASGSGSSKTQEENGKIMLIMVEELRKLGRSVTISELQKESSAIKDYVTDAGNSLSNQKLSALMRKLIADGTVVSVKEGKKSLFYVK